MARTLPRGLPPVLQDHGCLQHQQGLQERRHPRPAECSPEPGLSQAVLEKSLGETAGLGQQPQGQGRRATQPSPAHPQGRGSLSGHQGASRYDGPSEGKSVP